MKAWWRWFNSRTGLGDRVSGFLNHRLAGGPRWRHALYVALLFAFGVQVVTGFCLWTGYSASTQTAWESVYHLQHETTGGWLLRGLHHFTAQLVMVLLGLCIGVSIVSRAFRAPHEVGFWLLLAAVPLGVGMSVTGWLLPFDQGGYWAARVPLNLLAIVPVVGPALQTFLLGGPEVGHHTLTRFLALHAGLLPLSLGVVLFWAVRLLRRSAPWEPASGSASPWWPEQAWRDAVVCLGVLAVGLGLACSGHEGRGAPLGAPADLAEAYPAARPEWFFLFLYQFLKRFPGGTEVVGAVLIPGALMALLAAMPFIQRARRGHVVNVTVLALLVTGMVFLTGQALWQDRQDPAHAAALAAARRDAARVHALVRQRGIPPAGAAALVRTDPLMQGPRLFSRHCASCHRYDGHDGLGQPPADPPTAPDLKGFASREWLAGLLDPARITTPHYFGNTKHKDGKMARFVLRDVAGYDAKLQEDLRKVIAAVSAEAALPAQRELEARDVAAIEEGRKLAATSDLRCVECHQFRKPDEDATAPDLTGYGSREWLIGIMADPTHERFYGRRNDRMPSFGAQHILDEAALGMLADWLRGEE